MLPGEKVRAVALILMTLPVGLAWPNLYTKV